MPYCQLSLQPGRPSAGQNRKSGFHGLAQRETRIRNTYLFHIIQKCQTNLIAFDLLQQRAQQKRDPTEVCIELWAYQQTWFPWRTIGVLTSLPDTSSLSTSPSMPLMMGKSLIPFRNRSVRSMAPSGAVARPLMMLVRACKTLR